MTDGITDIDDAEAALTNHRETLTEIARAVGLDATEIPEDPETKARRAAFFGDSPGAKAYQKEAEATADFVRHFQESLELAERIADRVEAEHPKRSSARGDSGEAAAFRRVLRGEQ
jgi:hypothetical protein